MGDARGGRRDRRVGQKPRGEGPEARGGRFRECFVLDPPLKNKNKLLSLEKIKRERYASSLKSFGKKGDCA